MSVIKLLVASAAVPVAVTETLRVAQDSKWSVFKGADALPGANYAVHTSDNEYVDVSSQFKTRASLVHFHRLVIGCP
eukprot:2864359-Pleurochrysis_carterae.AAC.2